MSKQPRRFIGDGRQEAEDDSSSEDPGVPIDLSIDSSSRVPRVRREEIGIDERTKSSLNLIGAALVNAHFASRSEESPVDLVRRRSTRISRSVREDVTVNAGLSETWSVCDLCDATFTSKDSLHEHLRVTHKVTKNFKGLREASFESTLTAPKASVPLSSSRQSVIHETRQSHRQSYSQSAASSSSSTATATEESQDYIEHLAFTSTTATATTEVQTSVPDPTATASRDGKFPCGVCGKQLSSRAALIGHLRIHTGEKPHQCPICSRAFSSSQTLTRHLRTHTGEKPYECPVCGKRASLRHNMKLHMKIHQKDKRYSHPQC